MKHDMKLLPEPAIGLDARCELMREYQKKNPEHDRLIEVAIGETLDVAGKEDESPHYIQLVAQMPFEVQRVAIQCVLYNTAVPFVVTDLCVGNRLILAAGSDSFPGDMFLQWVRVQRTVAQTGVTCRVRVRPLSFASHITVAFLGRAYGVP